VSDVAEGITTCPQTLRKPGICCACDGPAAYAVLQELPFSHPWDLVEHLRCVECTARVRQDPLYIAIKTYQPLSGYTQTAHERG
jgi:hypothetical protein